MTKEAMKRALCVYLDAFENHLITNATSSNLDMTGHIAELVKEALANHIEDNLAMVAQLEQEPASVTYKEVADTMNCLWYGNVEQVQMAELLESKKLYTTPPKRTWVGLTDEEIWGTVSRIGTSDSDVNPYAKLADARAIETKLKEKNT